jgi:hypothetical protein
MITILSVIVVAVITLVSFCLALWCEYKDGVFGHFSLVLMGCSGTLLLIGIYQGRDYYLNPLTIGILMGAAIFLVRHMVNALRFRKRKA